VATTRKTRQPRAAGTGKPAVPLTIRKVARWGNSLGLRLPQEATELLGLRDGEEVSVEVRDGSITITPARTRWTEADLLKGVTPEAVRGEVDWGGPVGKEVW
jgi:antitoxin MazE